MNQAKYNLLCTILLTLSTLFLTGIEPIDSNIALAQVITPTNLVPAPSLQKEQPEELLTPSMNTLPPEVKTAVLEDAVRQTSKTVPVLRIIEFQKKTWSDGCLGIAEPDRLCTQVVTPGWRVVVTDGLRTWIYRTDNSGDLVKLEKSPQ